MDSFVLYSPAGSAVQLGSYVDWQAGGPDFGTADLIKANFAENPAAEGAVLGFETVNHRSMSFPLRLASAANPSGLPALESQLRLYARPGGYIDLQPENVASSEAVRFDIVAGRYEEHYDPFMNRVSRRDGTLKLDVQPYGYWPTEILLASSASVGLPGQLTLSGAGSVIGDAPGRARVVIIPTALATTYPAGSWVTDMVTWGFAGASFFGFFPGGTLTAFSGVSSLTGDKFAPGSQIIQYNASQNATWQRIALKVIPSTLEPAYRSRMRAFAWAQLSPSQSLPWYLSADLVDDRAALDGALASSSPIATLAPAVASGTPGGYGAQPSPGYVLLDLGELAPPASGVNLAADMRIWAAPATTNVGVASPVITIGGIEFVPVSEQSGFQPRGLRSPTVTATGGRQFGIDANGITDRFMFRDSAVGIAVDAGAGQYRGVLSPRIGASITDIHICGGHRKVASGARDPVVRAGLSFAQVSVSYQPRFSFLKGL